MNLGLVIPTIVLLILKTKNYIFVVSVFFLLVSKKQRTRNEMTMNEASMIKEGYELIELKVIYG